MMMDCQYVATQRGGVALVFEGHRYNKVRDGKDGTVYWRCSRDRQCPGRAVTVHSRIKKANNKHNHSPDNGVKSGQTLISSSQIGQLSQLGAAVGQNAMAQSLQGLNCNANSVAAMAAILGQGPGNNLTAAAVAALLQQQHNNAANASTNGTSLNSKHSNGLLNSSLLALSGSAHASLSQHSQHSSSSASSSPFQLDSTSENGTFNFPTLKQLNQINHQMNGGSANKSSLGALNGQSSSSLPNSPVLDSMLGLSSQNDFSVLQQLQNNLQNSHRSQQQALLSHTTHRSSSSSSTTNNHNHHHHTANNHCAPLAANQANSGSQSRENSSRDNSNNNSCNNSNNSSLSAKSALMINGLSKQQALLDAQTNAQLINELKLNSLMSLNSLVKNAVANQGNCNLNNLSNSLQNLNSLTGLTNLSNNLSSLNSLANQPQHQHKSNQTADHNKQNSNNNQNSINNCNGTDSRDDESPSQAKHTSNGVNGLLTGSSAASQLNNLLMQMEQMSQLANQNFKTDQHTHTNTTSAASTTTNPTNSSPPPPPPQSNGSPVALGQLNGAGGDQAASNDATMQTLNQLNNLLNNNLNNSHHNSLNNKLQNMLAFPSLVNETLKYFSNSSNPTIANALTSQMISEFGANSAADQATIGLNDELITDYYSDSSDDDQPLHMAVQSSSLLVKKLRQLMKNLNYVPEPLQAYIVPSCDSHQSEYIADCDKRRHFLTNFTGSDGTALITNEKHLLWTDGRYYAQAERELSDGWELMKDGQTGTPSQAEYLSKHLASGSKVGVDARLYSFSSFKRLNTALNRNGIELVPLMDNLVDLLWTDKPERPCQPIESLDIKFTGLGWQEKVQQVRQTMAQKDASVLVITALDETAWLFNLRGSDVEFNPVFFAYTILTQDSIYLFVEEEQLSSSARKVLGLDSSLNNSKQQTPAAKAEDSMTDSPLVLNSDEFRVTVRPYGSVFESLKEMLNTHQGKVWISKSSSYALVSLVPTNRHIDSPNPVLLAKVVKNAVEVECMRNAHIKDAVALCEFFAWLEEEVPKGTQTEISAAQKLYDLRKEQSEFIQNSFETISSSGPNGAIIHYKPTESTNRSLNVEEIYLCDSGAQYLDGTTDVANCIFPCGVKGHCFDTLARKALWECGLDYLHGTGHAVGCYLNVHEGPIGISARANPDDPGMSEGMILSNEPGYYEKDKFGIRIESLIVVTKKETQYNFNNRGYLCFDTITLVPIQTKLLEPSLLTVDEIEWLDNYHQTCREVIGNALKKQGKTAGYKLLMKETEPLG